MIKAQTLKGFRDFLPGEAKRRQYVINALKEVFELYGFEPLETPALEYQEVLTGKYGDEGEKLMYKFEDLGKRKVALRYDQTVPLARVAAQYQNDLPLPFKRYQIQNVWRAENTQKGRFREFLQVDADIIGSSSPLSDAEIISLASKSLTRLGFQKFKIFINDRNIIKNLRTSFEIKEKEIPFIFRCIDKVMKVGKEGVVKELQKEYSKEQAEELFDAFKKAEPTKNLLEIFDNLKALGVSEEEYKFDPYLARGLDYYSGMIVEVDIEGYKAGSIAGGGRYDNLIGIFSSSSIPAVGFSFGFDRLLEVMEEFNLFSNFDEARSILVAYPSPTLKDRAIKITNSLRDNNVSTEIYLGEVSAKNLLEKQLKYADKKGMNFVLIVEENGDLSLKDMEKRSQEKVTIEEALKKIS